MHVVRAFVVLVLLAASTAADTFESWPARATDAFPRNSEGDTVVLRDGTLLVAWTEFHGDGSDFATAHIAARKSTDGGRTWGEKFVLQENLGELNTMSLSFLRLADSGDLLMFFLVKHSRSDLDLYVRRSTDEAATWSEPVLITPEGGYHIMNNARAVQLDSGRIICPVSTTPVIHNRDHPLKNVCYLSDDQGHSWRRSSDAVAAPARGAMEPGVIERKDGSLLQIIRTQAGQIWVAESDDAGDHWSEARPWGIASPEAPATLAALPSLDRWLLIHNPTVDPGAASHGGRRTPLVARLSPDEGKTWSEPIPIEDDLAKTYAYVSARAVANRVVLTYYVEEAGRLDLKFKSLPLKELAP